MVYTFFVALVTEMLVLSIKKLIEKTKQRMKE